VDRLAKPTIALNVGASTIYKRWPAENWVGLAERLIGRGFSLILTAGPGEARDADQIAQSLEHKDSFMNLGGRTTLPELARVLQSSDLVISGDTGPMHLAAAVGTPTIGLFGPTDPRRTGPYGSAHQTIWKQIPCSPCFRKPTCEGRVDCLRAITVDDVMAGVDRHFARMPVASE
jgi:ADP-heptose:LPS heptosyltransferase